MFTTLNRAGIALNFVAGLLLAPHLIGEDRLERAASRIGERLRARLPRAAAKLLTTEWTAKRRRELLEADAQRRGVPITTLEKQAAARNRMSPDSSWYFVALVPVWLVAVLAIQLIRTGRIDTNDSWWPSVVVALGVGVVAGVVALLVATFWSLMTNGGPDTGRGRGLAFVFLALAFPLVGALLVVGLVASVPFLLVRATRARRWLITVMTSVGITAFTVGNALQFWATYED